MFVALVALRSLLVLEPLGLRLVLKLRIENPSSISVSLDAQIVDLPRTPSNCGWPVSDLVTI